MDLLQCAPEVAPLVEGYEPGRKARRDILREVYRRERAGERWPSLRMLGAALDLSHATVREHVNILQDAGLLDRDGLRLVLTDCARNLLDLEIGG